MHRLPPRVVSAVVEFAFGDLAREPRRVGKPLRREFAGVFSARRGPYRVLYRIDDDRSIVSILRVDHRAGVYRRYRALAAALPSGAAYQRPEAVLRHSDETSLTGCRATCGSSTALSVRVRSRAAIAAGKNVGGM